MKEMNEQKNIENLFKNLKNHYKVPPDYFEEREQRSFFEEDKKEKKRNFYWKWGVAAMLVVFLGLSFLFFNKNYENSRSLQHKPVNYVEKEKDQTEDFFEDLDEDIIEEYLVDNRLMEDFFTDEMNN